MQHFTLTHLEYINKMQCVQNAAAKVVLKKLKYDSASRARFELHWLP